MTNNNHSIRNGSTAQAAGRLSMISILAIAAGLAAAPAQAQSAISPSDMPMQSPVAAPQPTPAPAPVMQPSPVTIMPVTAVETKPSVTADRADALATEGGFDAATVAPEALAQIENEKQARSAAAAESAAAAKATASARTSVSARTPADSGADAVVAPVTPVAEASGTSAGFENAPLLNDPAPVAIESVTAADDTSGTDWTLLAALAGLIGIGGAGAYAASRRRKSNAEPVGAYYRVSPASPAVTAATMPELRRDPGEPKAGPEAESAEQRAVARAHLTDFVAGLPSFEAPRSKADRHVTIGQRRVAAAPRPYLSDTDLSRRPGYFTAHVDAIPTPQNPFLTRQKRLKRARHLDAMLAGMKSANALKPTGGNGTMQASRPKASALH
tara:strand:- start:18492 stop:19649 length:1158 start_codon:yes stop_codon:yes gene_type:complete